MLRLVIALVLLAPLTAACGSTAEPADDAAGTSTASAMEAVSASVSSQPAVVADGNVDASDPTGNAAAWSDVDLSASEFAGRLDAATQAIAGCEMDAAAGGDFTACLGDTFAAVADAQEGLVATIDEALPQADGDCRSALGEMRAAASAMAEDYRGAIGITDMTTLESAYERLAADASAYASAAMGAGAVCAA